jgi:hypothetical protein
MARHTQTINVGGQSRETWKITGAVTDLDVGKPVKIASTDLLALCSDGDQIYGFIDTVEAGGTSDGKVVVTIVSAGRVYAILSGSSTFGGMVEAAANTAVGVAKAGNYGLVSTHTVVTATEKMWKIISGAVTDGATVLLEKQ